MEENDVFETEELTEEEAATFDESWDDDSMFDAEGSAQVTEEPEEAETEDDVPASEEEPGEDTATEEAAEDQKSEEPKEEEKPEEGNQLFKINYLGKEEELTLEQMTELAQKGRDYDHVREERDKLRGASKAGDRQMKFLEDLAKRSGLTVDEQIDRTRALWLMNEEAEKGNEISEADALRRVQRDKPDEAAKEKESGSSEKDYNPQIDRFLSVYPDVQAVDIPQEVWAEAHRLGGDLLAAYQAHEIKQLKAAKAKETETQQKTTQNDKNQKRSTGPRQSAGNGRTRDDFDEGWDS